MSSIGYSNREREVETVEAGPIRDRKLFNKIRQNINLIIDRTFGFWPIRDAKLVFKP